jgi:hypothetical protein
MNPINPHVSQTSTSWQTRFTFSGKEKDAEINLLDACKKVKVKKIH